jgi:hypothetical protein
MDSLTVATLVVLIINYIICVGSLPSVVFLRNIQPIKARSFSLLTFLLLTLLLDQTKLFLKVYHENCLRDFWLDFIATNSLLFTIGMRAGRLLAIFNITKNKLEEKGVT